MHPNDNYLPEGWGNLVVRIQQMQTESGSFYDRLESQKVLVSYCYFPSMSWTVIAVQPSEDLLEAARTKIMVLVAILAVLLVTSLAIMFVLLLHIYQPIDEVVSQIVYDRNDRKIIDEMTVISDELDATYLRSDNLKQSLNQANLQSLLLGLPYDVVELPPVVSKARKFIVGVLTPAKRHEYTVHELNQLAMNCMTGLKACYSFRWTDHRALLFCFDEIDSKELSEQLDDFCSACRKTHPEVRFGVSDPVDNPKHLHFAYTEALRFSSDAFYHPERTLFTSDVVQQYRSTPISPIDTWVNRISAALFNIVVPLSRPINKILS